MTVQKIKSSNVSDDSDMVSLSSEDELCRRKYQLLLERCEVLQQDNERIINRINGVKKITKRYRRDIKLLMERLDMYKDPYRTVDLDMELKPDATFGLARTTIKSQPRKQIEKPKLTMNKKVRRKRAEKPEKDPKAPKKPCNAFFQFCQEQRSNIIADMTAKMGIEPNKQEITRHMASKWRELTHEEKKIYVAMFERSKEKYVEEMSAYVKKEQ